MHVQQLLVAGLNVRKNSKDEWQNGAAGLKPDDELRGWPLQRRFGRLLILGGGIIRPWCLVTGVAFGINATSRSRQNLYQKKKQKEQHQFAPVRRQNAQLSWSTSGSLSFENSKQSSKCAAISWTPSWRRGRFSPRRVGVLISSPRIWSSRGSGMDCSVEILPKGWFPC